MNGQFVSQRERQGVIVGQGFSTPVQVPSGSSSIVVLQARKGATGTGASDNADTALVYLSQTAPTVFSASAPCFFLTPGTMMVLPVSDGGRVWIVAANTDSVTWATFN